MWWMFAAGSALFSGLTAVLAKCGIDHTNSTVATAIRTVVVLAFSWLMVFLVGSQSTIGSIEPVTWLFLGLSGLATGASWLCYFKALQLGDVNRVAPLDKSSTVLTMLLAIAFLGERASIATFVCIALILVGTLLMIEPARKASSSAPAAASPKGSWGWLVYGLLSALFAALTAILGKVGIQGVESNLGTALRTIVVLVLAWAMVPITGHSKDVRSVPRRDFWFICLSGVATGAAWLCYYRALQLGPASLVVPVDKLSIVVTIAFSWIILKEPLSCRAGLGLVLIVVGTLGMALGA